MTILIIDDDPAIRFALKELLTDDGYNIEQADSGENAFSILKDQSIDIIILDYQLPGMNGMELLSLVKKDYPSIPVIFITAFGNTGTAIQAIKSGAYDYVAKPFNNDELLNRINHIRKSLEKNRIDLDERFGYYFSNSAKSMIEKIKTIAKTDIPVLITGESGVGKELFARMIHYYSERTGKSVTVNCSSLPPSLIESELFGAEKGSYTGAFKTKTGFFEQADNGTLFLDEIGEMPIELQSKLLRVLQEGEIYRVGSSTPIKISARIIAATNIDIDNSVKEKAFREDLFYRLNGVRFIIPPLRERKDEIKLLSQVFLKEFNNKYHKKILGFGDDIISRILHYGWPGNIRELRTKIEESVIFCNSEWITGINIATEKDKENSIQSLKQEMPGIQIKNIDQLPKKIIEAKRHVTDLFEKEFILYYLQKNDWKVAKTADEIGMFRQDLYKKIKKMNINKKTS